MKGVTLLEFFLTVSFFLTILFFGYHAFDLQKDLLVRTISRTRPEEESNYRAILLKHLIEDSSRKLQIDSMLEGATIFFEDLAFGNQARTDAFSVVHVQGSPVHFLNSGSDYTVPSGSRIVPGNNYLLAGSDSNGNYGWGYYKALQVSNTASTLALKLQPLQSDPRLEKGTLIEVEIHGFLFKNSTLYRISSGGATQPFLEPLDEFRYSWDGTVLTVTWRRGAISMEFKCKP